jgi:hypothetical protein
MTPLSRAAAGVAAFAWLGLLALLAAANAWVFSGAFAPLPLSPPTYIIVVRPVASLAMWWLIAIALLAACYVTIASRRASVFAPLLLLALPLAGIGAAAAGWPSVSGPIAFVLVDLRWWLWAAALVLTAREMRSASGPSRPHEWPIAARVHTGLLLVVLLAAALIVTPSTRFTSAVNGDEPKYLRYLETWYRGRGMDITGLVPLSQLPADDGSRLLGNLPHVAAATVTIARDLAGDVTRRFGASVESPPAAFSRGGHFVEGRHGGVYQVHNPGMSLLILPGYVIDRALLNAGTPPNPDSQFPRHLYATGALVLAMYLLWGAALLRVVTACTTDRTFAWLTTAAAMLSLPAIAFSYQFYPEASGGLFIAVAAGYVLNARDSRAWVAFVHGLAAGYLPWMHLRYAALTIVLGVMLALARWTDRRRLVLAFWIGLAVPLALLCLYTYYVTGSLIPSRMWTLLVDRPVFNARGIPARTVGLFLDANWGAIAHAPVYLLALAGCWPLWQRNRRAMVLVGLLVIGLAVPVAGHDWTGGGTTAARLIAATVVLLAVPLAEALTFFRRSRLFLAAFAVLGAISVHNGLVYNAHFDRTAAAFAGPTFSGWLTRLAFPYMDVSPERSPLLLSWIAIGIVLLLLPMLRRHDSAAPRMAHPATALAAMSLALALGGATIALATGVASRTRFMADAGATRDRILHFFLEHRGARTWSAAAGPVRLEDVFPNPPNVEVKVAIGAPGHAGQPVTIAIEALGADRQEAWGVAMIDFGDGTAPMRAPVLGTTTVQHAFARPGTYNVSASVALPGIGSINRRETVAVLGN